MKQQKAILYMLFFLISTAFISISMFSCSTSHKTVASSSNKAEESQSGQTFEQAHAEDPQSQTNNGDKTQAESSAESGGPASGLETASFNKDKKLPQDARIYEGRLHNGLEYAIQKNTKPAKRASLRLVVNAGSVLEEENQRGLAHFVEHMAFNGTEDFEKQEIIDYMESIGMKFGPEVNAYTSFDETVYKLEVPTDSEQTLDTAFHILEQWAHAIQFDPKEVDKERGVIKEEWRLGRGAMARIRDKIIPELFRGSEYENRLPIGSMDVVMNAPAERLADFYRTWYRPELMDIVAVGDFDTEKIESLIKKYFTFEHAGPSPERPDYSIPEVTETRTEVITDPELSYGSVELMYKKPSFPLQTQGHYRQFAEDQLIYSMLNSRLRELTRKSDPPFLQAQVRRNRLIRSSSIVDGVAVTGGSDLSAAFSSLVTEIERAKSSGFSQGEIKRKQEDIIASLKKAYNQMNDIPSGHFADQIVNSKLNNIVQTSQEFDYHFFKQVLPGITPKEVNKRVKELFRGKDRFILATLPDKNNAPTQNSLISALAEAENKNLAAYSDNYTERPLMKTKPEPGSIKSIKTLENINTTIWELSNGITVAYKDTDFKQDNITFSAFSPGGSSTAGDETYFSAEMAPSVMSESGIADFTASDLEKFLQGKNLSVSPYINDYFEGFSGHSTPDDLETAFRLIHLYFTNPRFDEDAYNSLVDRLLQVAENRKNKPTTVLQDRITEVLYNNHPRRQPLSKDLIQTLDFKTSKKLYKERMEDAGDFTFVFVGDIHPAELKTFTETYLASLPATGRNESWKDTGIRYPKQMIEDTVKRGIADKGMVHISYPGKTEWTLETAELIGSLKEILSIRLRNVLREELGSTYGVSVNPYLSPRPVPSSLISFRFGCSPDKIKKLSGILRKELFSIVNNGASEENIKKAESIYKQQYEKQQEQNGFWLNHISRALRENIDAENLFTPDEHAEHLTSERISNLAETLIDKNHYIQVTLVPESSESSPKTGKGNNE